MESEYNGAICDVTFDLLLRNGAFGSMRDIPRSLLGKEVRFRFESPLQEAIEREKVQRFRELLKAVGVPAKWIRDEAEADAMQAQQEEQKQAQEAMMAAAQGAQAVEMMGNAKQSVVNANNAESSNA